MEAHRLTREDARRIAVRAQLLDEPRPDDLVDVVRRLTLLQVDLTAAIAPSADLVLWSRLGASYDPDDLERAFEAGHLVEVDGLIRPAEDLALFRADMAEWPGTGPLRDWQEYQRDWVDANETCRREILLRLELDGPLAARDLPDVCDVPWRSSGWTNSRNVLRLLGFMARRGEVAVAGRDGRERMWDLAARVWPEGPSVPSDRAHRIRAERRLRALGLARAKASASERESDGVGDVGEPAVVEGVRGLWRVDPESLDGPQFSGRVALLSPLDRLVFDRRRMVELFGFDYQLEMYKPAAARRWGYWALPILSSEALVGKVDATADRAAGVLRVAAIHEDEPFPRALRAAVREEVASLADWLELDVVHADG